jgi:hypothetical protein
MSRLVLRIAVVVSVGTAVDGGAGAETAELLILPASNSEFIRQCNQSDVVISGSHSKYVLVGGCHSLSVPGDGNEILVELAAGSEIYLRGKENAIAWKKMPGPDPTIVVDGPSNSVIQLEQPPDQSGSIPAGQPTSLPAATGGAATSVTTTEPKPQVAVPAGKSVTAKRLLDQRLRKIQGTGAHPLRQPENAIVLSFGSGTSPTVRQCQQSRNGRTECKDLNPSSDPNPQDPTRPIVWRFFSDDKPPPDGHEHNTRGRR